MDYEVLRVENPSNFDEKINTQQKNWKNSQNESTVFTITLEIKFGDLNPLQKIFRYSMNDCIRKSTWMNL